MTAKLTITLSDEVLKALQKAKSITVALGSGGKSASRAAPAKQTKAKRGRRAGKRKAAKATRGKGKAGAYRAGSPPAKLLSWAGGRKKPFGVPDVMKAMRIKRGHASMLIAYVTNGGALRRVGRGSYEAA